MGSWIWDMGDRDDSGIRIKMKMKMKKNEEVAHPIAKRPV